MADEKTNSPKTGSAPINVGLFATCLVDLFRPTVGFAAAQLIEAAGCTVHVPDQTCCGQPAHNSGDRNNTRQIARQVIETFERFDYVVAPSGSCGGMIAVHYPELFADDPEWSRRARALAAKTFELTTFLADIMKIEGVTAHYDGTATYHDACAGLRELGVRDQPRELLAGVDGLAVEEMAETEACCGFGGTFCVKYGEISTDIVSRKTANVVKTGADLLLAGDLGCLLNIAGRLKREGSSVQVRHVAEVLAGMTDQVPPIGEAGETGGEG
ncbi:MAG: (Fe-S)-binding protein [Rhodospirillaceae bacterium]|jgi:L-lactate dehydrogenase complex protein LldE|nr:(Fe-S)-binding protein [Rhodospirillaceae bacterium]MBT4687889.1 (Fe-S)-binding protein [Rhodospirillaceae bacterium]MBT5083153.1 (Fe-S)-binding protein [Rhodospirillaceae bacterium]MBT5523353.1 (Fe-S)-binding protein [Rhodospirillaceae bacterium]MBT5877538.1 (Fe-S)-binding protein [Rhodospirillaceae bacterium]